MPDPGGTKFGRDGNACRKMRIKPTVSRNLIKILLTVRTAPKLSET